MTDDDLTRELHHMETQVEQHGYPGTRAVLAELERLRAENARYRAALSHLLLFARGNEHVLRLIHDTLDAR